MRLIVPLLLPFTMRLRLLLLLWVQSVIEGDKALVRLKNLEKPQLLSAGQYVKWA